MKHLLVIITIFLIQNYAHAESLTDISTFSKDICDEIATEGEIRRDTIEGKIGGKLSGVAKLIGASIGADGSIKIDKEKYNGIPYESLPEQLSDARDCRKQLTLIFLKERQEVELLKAEKLSEQSDLVQNCEISYACDQSKMEGVCLCREVVEGISKDEGHSKQQAGKLYVDTCLPQVSTIKECWNKDEDLTLQRSKCDAALKLADVKLPEPSEDSCLAGNK
jgi:hypothetical protein